MHTLYSPSECITARYFRVGRCLIRHRSLQERGSPEKTEKTEKEHYHHLLLIHPASQLISLPFYPTLTTAGITFLLKLPVGVGRSRWCLQNTTIRMSLATVDYKTVCK